MIEEDLMPLGWHVHIGFARVYIAGPGYRDWWPISDSLQHTPKEDLAAIVKVGKWACRLLTKEFGSQPDVEHANIRKALEACGWKENEWTKYPDKEELWHKAQREFIE